ncbi:hypothetical protein PQX77_004307 [Marasmius sp. AFHP31]|nr:hypothetical protein PQX77_004307 [Marasmius sp. AFHP31]
MLTAFLEGEGEGLVGFDCRLNKLWNSWASEQGSIYELVEGLDEFQATWNFEQKVALEQVEKQTRMLEDGFSQLKGIQQVLSLLSQQPVPLISNDKLEWFTLTLGSSLDRIRTLEVALSRLHIFFDKQLQTNRHELTSAPPKLCSQSFADLPGIGYIQLPYAGQKPPRYRRKMRPKLSQGHCYGPLDSTACA